MIDRNHGQKRHANEWWETELRSIVASRSVASANANDEGRYYWEEEWNQKEG